MNLRIRFFMYISRIVKIHRDRLDDVGTMAYPLSYMQPKIPGLGDIDWGRLLAPLWIQAMTAQPVSRSRTGHLKEAPKTLEDQLFCQSGIWSSSSFRCKSIKIQRRKKV